METIHQARMPDKPTPNTNQHQPMKTKQIAIIVAALSLAVGGSLSASPRGKHVSGEPFPHRHGVKNGSTTVVNHTMLKRVGPPGKGFVRTLASNR
jgi:hypothetical protein